MSPEKTLITHAGTEKARFLGYDIGIEWRSVIRQTHGHPRLRLPIQKLKEKIAKYMRNGKPLYRGELIDDSDFSIITLYGSEYRGLAQYYALADNRHWLNRLFWVMRRSLFSTLARKHQSTVTKMARKYQTETYHRGKTLRCFEAKIERPGRKPLIARFGGIRLSTDISLPFDDREADQDRKIYKRSELEARLLADTCELCGSTERVQVHHVRKLADLKVRGRKEAPTWKQVMASRKRKTLAVCHSCHVDIHAGRPTGVTQGR